MKYEEAEVDKSAIMQNFQDNEKKQLKGRLAAIFNFIKTKFFMGYHCVRPYILFYLHKYHKITQIQNGR